MRRLLAGALFLVLLPVAHAEAVTIRDIVDLTKAGVGEEILLALIEVDGSVFRIDTLTLTMLKEEGVSERVILAMVKSGRTRPVEAPAPPPIVEVVEAPAPPLVVVIDHHERPVPVPVAVPVYIPVYPRSREYLDRRVEDVERLKPAAPVYWGFGGKLRPDAWQPAAGRVEASAPGKADGSVASEQPATVKKNR
jgi:hypothetical protein